MSGRYDDILYMECPVSERHQPMSREERAKQFSPFVALKGHTEAIASEERIFAQRAMLSEDLRKVLDERFHWIQERYEEGKSVEIELRRFLPVLDDENGYLVTVKGIVRKIDIDARLLDVDGDRIPFDDIEEIMKYFA